MKLILASSARSTVVAKKKVSVDTMLRSARSKMSKEKDPEKKKALQERVARLTERKRKAAETTSSNLPTRVTMTLSSVPRASVEAVTEEQFKKWDKTRQSKYLKEHPTSRFGKKGATVKTPGGKVDYNKKKDAKKHTDTVKSIPKHLKDAVRFDDVKGGLIDSDKLPKDQKSKVAPLLKQAMEHMDKGDFKKHDAVITKAIKELGLDPKKFEFVPPKPAGKKFDPQTHEKKIDRAKSDMHEIEKKMHEDPKLAEARKKLQDRNLPYAERQSIEKDYYAARKQHPSYKEYDAAQSGYMNLIREREANEREEQKSQPKKRAKPYKGTRVQYD